MFRQLYKTIRYTAAFTPKIHGVIKAQRPPRVKAHDIPVDEAGNTPLHQLASSSIHANQLYRFIESNSPEKAKVMAAMANNEGQLPIDRLVKQNEIIRNALINLATPANYLAMNEPMNLDDLIPPYSDYSNNKFLVAFEIGCKIANKARKAIKQSTTHPECEIHTKTQVEISKKIDQLRNHIPHHHRYDVEELRKYSKLIEQFQVGNCHEYSVYALNQLTQESAKYVIRGELAHIVNGDHVFVVLNRDQNSDPHNYKTWGLNTIIVDAWYGQIFPVTEIEMKLSDYRSFEGGAFSFNILAKFNDKHHRIKITSVPMYSQCKSSQTFFKQQHRRGDDKVREVSLVARPS